MRDEGGGGRMYKIFEIIIDVKYLQRLLNCIFIKTIVDIIGEGLMKDGVERQKEEVNLPNESYQYFCKVYSYIIIENIITGGFIIINP
jgi:hypothetical protein